MLTQLYDVIFFLQCDHTASLDAFFDLFWQSNTTYVTLLGCGCSQATIPVAETSHYWNIPQVKCDFMCIINNLPLSQIAFAAAANVLKDRHRFRSFFRVIPSLSYIPVSTAQLMRQFNWRKMTIITQDETLFQAVSTILISW